MLLLSSDITTVFLIWGGVKLQVLRDQFISFARLEQQDICYHVTEDTAENLFIVMSSV